MIKKALTSILMSFILHFNFYAQIDLELLKMTVYKDDPDAEALIIKDIGNSRFVMGSETELIFERTVKIKILKEAGIKHAQISIPLYNSLDYDYEEVQEFEGVTYNYENGSLTTIEVDSKSHHIEKNNQHWSQYKIAMPNVKVGSIIEYKYKISSPFYFNLQDWNFQSTIPTLYSEYNVGMNPFYEYIYIYQGNDTLDIKDSYIEKGFEKRAYGIDYKEKIYKFAIHNIPAFKDEDFITSKEDFITKLDFQLAGIHYPNGTQQTIMTTWDEAINDLLKDEHFGYYLKKSERLADNYIDIDSLLKLQEHLRYTDAVTFIKDNVNWNGFYSTQSKSSPKQVIESRSANIAEINLLLTGFLRANGLEAYPVLISTRSHGKIKVNYPFMSHFNYVITLVRVNNQYFLLDASDKLCADNRIPLKCFNDIGLVVKNDEVNWISTPSLCESNTSYFITTTIDSSTLSSKSTLSTTFTEYDAYSKRQEFGNDEKQISEYYFDKFNINIDTFLYVRNGYERNKPYLMSFIARNKLTKYGNKLIINPLLGLIPNENIFKQKNREHPVDLIYKTTRNYTINLRIPDGYSITKIPDNLMIDNPDFTLKYAIKEFNSFVAINFIYHFKERMYSAESYEKLKEFYQQIMEKGNENIVLEKTSLLKEN